MNSVACNKEMEQLNTQSHGKTKATIMSLPIEVVIMIIAVLCLEDALELCKVLKLQEQVAVQYFLFDRGDVLDILDITLKPNSYKFMLKNKGFQIRASSIGKTLAALKTFDLEFVMKSLEEFKPDLNHVLLDAIWIGFTDVAKLLLSDPRVDPSADDNEALRFAVVHRRAEVVKLLLSDPRVNQERYVKIVKNLLSDYRV